MSTPPPLTRTLTDLNAWRARWLAARDHPDAYWLERTRALLSWHTPPTIGCEGDFWSVQEAPLRWFADGRLNVSYECLDRHLPARADQTAIIWEADEPGQHRHITYAELHAQVCAAARALTRLGVKAGDRVMIYMGMTPEAAVAMLACARVGAVHSVVFGGFSADALRDRVLDSGAEVILTQDEGRRGGRPVPLKAVVDSALASSPEAAAQVRRVVVSERVGAAGRAGAPWGWVEGRDLVWADCVRDEGAPDGGAPDGGAHPFESEHPLFILYTSGSTGKPKGLLHTSGGYLTYAAHTHREVFGLREGDVYACVADLGWVTGHSYILYGPLANGATTLMFESTPLYPDPGRYWRLIETHKVNIFYTAPTALRALMAEGDRWPASADLTSLRVLGTVGEPINPEAWRWYHDRVGGGRCAVVDTWWQTETGGICISPIAHVTPTKPGAATRPLPGIAPVLLSPEGRLLHGPAEGHLCIDQPWPGQARTVWGDHARFVSTYFSQHPGRYFTGDGCRRDAEGDHWVTGRVDDVINVSGHRMGTAEFEAALMLDPRVSEAAVVGYPHPLKGQGVCAYVVLSQADMPLARGATLTPEALTALQGTVRAAIGAHAKLDRVIAIPGLPKTRSGKVMRRILRKVAEGVFEDLGDISTLADPGGVSAIIEACRGEAGGGAGA
jgi:acetyl-CoA synthetase